MICIEGGHRCDSQETRNIQHFFDSVFVYLVLLSFFWFDFFFIFVNLHHLLHYFRSWYFWLKEHFIIFVCVLNFSSKTVYLKWMMVTKICYWIQFHAYYMGAVTGIVWCAVPPMHTQCALCAHSQLHRLACSLLITYNQL